MNVGAHVGRAETGDQVVGINSGEIWIALNPAADYKATRTAIEEVASGYPELFRDIDTYQPEHLSEALLGTNEDLVVRVYGPDLGVLYEKADELVQLVNGVDGVVEAHADHYAEEPQVEIEVNLDAAEQLGIKPGDVRRQATTLLSGLHVGSLFEEQKVFEVIVWGTPEIRGTVDDISKLLIDAPHGEQIALGEVADVRVGTSPIVITRDAVSRYVDLSVNVDGRSLNAVIADIRAQLRQTEFPLEYRAEVLSEQLVEQNAQRRTLAVAIAAIIGIYLLLQAAYNSWRLAFFMFITTPVALAGGALALTLGGGLITLGALFGFLTLLSMAVRDALVQVAHLQEVERQTDQPFGPDLVMHGARQRVGALILTACTIAVIFVPLLFLSDAPGYEVVRPMGIVILGGVLASTLNSLFVVPALYLRFRPEPSTDELSMALEPALETS
jgi:Cu/Ag efflux pump CusA